MACPGLKNLAAATPDGLMYNSEHAKKPEMVLELKAQSPVLLLGPTGVVSPSKHYLHP
jgi:hypothetical protein